MKALSIKQPWADLILFNGKDVENRTWRCPNQFIGQTIYIHAGKKPDGLVDGIGPERFGAILGEVCLTACVTQSDSEWFYGPYGFVLAKPLAYKKPIPCKGSLGFFDIPASVKYDLAVASR